VLSESSTFLRNVGLKQTAAPKSVSLQMQELRAQLEAEKEESAGLRQKLQRLEAHAEESEAKSQKQAEQIDKQAEQIHILKKASVDTQNLVRQMIAFGQSQVNDQTTPWLGCAQDAGLILVISDLNCAQFGINVWWSGLILVPGTVAAWTFTLSCVFWWTGSVVMHGSGPALSLVLLLVKCSMMNMWSVAIRLTYFDVLFDLFWMNDCCGLNGRWMVTTYEPLICMARFVWMSNYHCY